MTAPPSLRREAPKNDSERMAAARACFRHLADLKQAHEAPPADVPVRFVSTPRFVPGILEFSWCGSPAAMCAELGEQSDRPADGVCDGSSSR